MRLFGHDAAIAEFRAAIDSGRLHHAWLLAGPHGVGKARFAEFAARRLLAESEGGPAPAGEGLDLPDDHPAVQLVNAESHPDFRRLERLPRDRKELERPRAERDPSAERARNITIDQVRGLQSLFGTTPAISRWRAVVIDALDDLERPAANALLKNLEEPPTRSIFLLVCHNPGRLLPTLRSRCRMLRFGVLEDDAMASAIRQAQPELGPEEVAALVGTGRGAPGQALRYAGLDIGGLDAAIDELIGKGDSGGGRRSALAQSLGAKNAQGRYEAFLERVPTAIARHAATLRGTALAEALAIWEEARSLAGSASRLSLDPQSTVFALAGMLAGLHEPRHG